MNSHQALKQVRRLSAIAHNSLTRQAELQTLRNQFLFTNKFLLLIVPTIIEFRIWPPYGRSKAGCIWPCADLYSRAVELLSAGKSSRLWYMPHLPERAQQKGGSAPLVHSNPSSAKDTVRWPATMM